MRTRAPRSGGHRAPDSWPAELVGPVQRKSMSMTMFTEFSTDWPLERE